MEQIIQDQNHSPEFGGWPNKNGDLHRANKSLREEVERLRHRNAELVRQVYTISMGSRVERDSRRAALNLMEDAVRARNAQQLENEERCKAEEKLRDASRRKDEFLATLAHELRNPLAPIRSSLHILRTAGASNGAVTPDLCRMLERQVNHMVHLVDDLMEVSRITRGQIVLRKERVDLESIVHRAIEASHPTIEAAHHHLSVSLPPEPVYIEADSVRMTQVITNLLNNAAKYTDNNGTIELSARLQNSHVEISVRDNGVGIASEMLGKIFDLFTQVDGAGSRGQGGLGIGLSLAQTLVESHGGKIEARSEGLGHGSEFVFSLPVVNTSPDSNILEANPLDGKRDQAQSRRILVVDDNEDAALTLSLLLQSIGAEVEIAHDGLAALEAFKKFKPSVMLLDIGMPDIDGLEIARRVRREEYGRDVVLMAITGWGQPEDRERTKDAGFDHHLIKPVDFDALERLLNSLPQP